MAETQDGIDSLKTMNSYDFETVFYLNQDNSVPNY